MSETTQFHIVPPTTEQQNGSRKSVETRILFICQAEGLQSRYSELNSEDSGLTALGWEQTNSLARWIVTHEKIDILLSAPQLRSRLTAQRLGQVLGKAVMIAPELPSHSRMGSELGSERQYLFAPLHVSDQFSTTEAYNAFQAHLAAALQKIANEHWGKTICVVLDGNAVAAAISIFCRTPRLSFSVHHTSLSEVAWHNGEWCIVYLNRLEHRPAPALPNTTAPTGTPATADDQDDGEDMSQVLAVYNRVLSADVDLDDHLHGQRLQHLLKFASLGSDLRVMDIGTGTGQLALLLAESGAKEVVGIDISPAMLEIAEYFRLSSATSASKAVSFRLAAAQRVPFRSESFDAVTCRLVLHHSQKPERILNEAVRLLKPNGVLILADLLGADDPVKRATQNTIEERRNPSHVAALSTDQYHKLINSVGLQIEQEAVAVFEQDLEEWLSDLESNSASRSVVREMMEAGLETDAAGLNVRRHSGKLVFDQQLIYIKARKPAS